MSKLISKEEFYNTLKTCEYGQQYLDLCLDPKNHISKKEKGENHHIHLRSLGGVDEDNVVRLSTYNHCLAHVLLAKAAMFLHTNWIGETVIPITIMSGQQFHHLSELEKITLEDIYNWSQLVKEGHKQTGLSQRGRLAWNSGKKCPQISKSRKGQFLSQEHKNNISKGVKKAFENIDHNIFKHNLGIHFTEERKNKISNSNKGKHNNVGKNNPMYGKKHTKESIDKQKNTILQNKEKIHQNNLIRRQNELNKRKENLINVIKEKNPEFLNKFNIIGDWNGELRDKIQVQCKKCGYIREFLYTTIISIKKYSCKGCTFLKNTKFSKLELSKEEFIKWLNNYKPNTLNKIEILDNNIGFYNDEINIKCLKCGMISTIKLKTITNINRNSVWCPICSKKHISYKYLEELINNHKNIKIINKFIDINNDYYEFNLKCNIHNKEYIIKGSYKHLKAICKSKSCGCELCKKEIKKELIKYISKLSQKKEYKEIWICPYCRKEYNNPRSFAGHKTMCIKNPEWDIIKIKRYK